MPPGGTSGGGKGGGAVLSTDDQEASLVCERAVPGDLTTECVAPGPGEVGDFIGAQMAAENLGNNRITPLIAWPAPASIVLRHAARRSAAERHCQRQRRRGGRHASPIRPPLGAILQAGPRTLQVAFTPFDAATFGTQTMTMSITIDRAPLSVVANHQTKIYGSPDPPLSFVATGFQAGDTEATALSGALAVEPGASVGSYAIGSGTLAASGNYTLGFTGSTLDITPANLTITAGDGAKVYGAAFAASKFTASGLLNARQRGQRHADQRGCGGEAPAGSYDIVPSAAVGTGLGNYAIVYTNGSADGDAGVAVGDRRSADEGRGQRRSAADLLGERLPGGRHRRGV